MLIRVPSCPCNLCGAWLTLKLDQQAGEVMCCLSGSGQKDGTQWIPLCGQAAVR